MRGKWEGLLIFHTTNPSQSFFNPFSHSDIHPIYIYIPFSNSSPSKQWKSRTLFPTSQLLWRLLCFATSLQLLQLLSSLFYPPLGKQRHSVQITNALLHSVFQWGLPNERRYLHCGNAAYLRCMGCLACFGHVTSQYN